ncbi:hypothetical protein ABBQ38_002999 [Trebouxia sp. C0009 RCD-2024]
MEATKPRSCLSDAFKAVRAREGSNSLSSSRSVSDHQPFRRFTPPAAVSRCHVYNGSTKDLSNSVEATRELQQILSQAQQSNKSSIFGCSPPVRADNPVIHDSTFAKGSTTERTCGAFCSAFNQSVGFESSALSTA